MAPSPDRLRDCRAARGGTVCENLPNMARDICERTFRFSCAIVGLYPHLRARGGAARAIADQLLDAGTSIGANMEEAEGAHSRADFIARCSVSLKEAREAHYWLRLLFVTKLAAEPLVRPHLIEAQELVAILTAIRRNARG
jgi:four helix bundle protein